MGCPFRSLVPITPRVASLGYRAVLNDDVATRFENSEQSYTATCPEGTDGDPVEVVIPAGEFVSYQSQAIADAQALALARAEAEEGLVCVPVVVCPERTMVFQVCNENALRDDNFNVYLNDVFIGYLNLDEDAQVGAVFIASENPSYTITEPDFACPIEGMTVYRFPSSLVVEGANVIRMDNAQENYNGNFGTVQVRNYLRDGNNLVSPCVVADLEFSGETGESFTLPFTYDKCCADEV